MRRLLLLIIAGAAALAAGQKVVGGPVVVNLTASTATVVWVVESDQVTLRAPAGAPARVSPSLRVEKTTLAGLQPNTRYAYDVGGADGVTGSFKTPPNGGAPFQFVVFGETRTRHDVHRRVIEALLKHGVPDFVLHTGDLVANGNETSLWPVFFDIEKDLLRQAAFFPSLGNHERNSRDFYDIFQVTTPYYSFNWGNAHFIILNSDIGNVATSKFVRDAYWAEQTRWLEGLAGSQKADYRFVVAPLWSKYSSATGDAPLSCSFIMQDNTWARLLAYVMGLVNRRLLLQCEYLIAENRILRSHVSGKLRLWDPERCTLAEIGKRFGRKYLAEVAYVAKPETILTWYRRLIARKFDGPKHRAYAERPRVDAAVEALIVRMAQENAG